MSDGHLLRGWWGRCIGVAFQTLPFMDGVRSAQICADLESGLILPPVGQGLGKYSGGGS
jgi:hypothetical protein